MRTELMMAAVGVATLVSQPGRSSEPYDSGGLVYDICSGEIGPAPNCNLYVAGVVDGIALSRPSHLRSICIPADAEPTALADAVWSFVARHPYEMGADGAQIVLDAATEAFPCR